MQIKWAHLVTPQGESFQGFWIIDDNGQPINGRPFATKESAVTYLRVSSPAYLKTERKV